MDCKFIIIHIGLFVNNKIHFVFFALKGVEMASTKKTFSQRLKTARLDKGYTQQEISERLQTTQGAYQKWESGVREPSFRTVMELTKILDVSVDYLFGAEIPLEDGTIKDKDTFVQGALDATKEYSSKLDTCIYNLIQLLEVNELTRQEFLETIDNIVTISKLRHSIDIKLFIVNMINKWITFDEEKSKLLEVLAGDNLGTKQ